MVGTAAEGASVSGLLSVPEAARRLGVDRKTLRKAVAAGDLKVVKLAGVVRIPTAEVQRLLAAAS